MSGQHGATKFYLVAVMQHSIHFRGRIERSLGMTVLEIIFAPCLNHRRVGIHHHVAGPGQLLHQRTARAVVKMGVADEQDLDVAEMKSQFLHAFPDERRGSLETAVDQDVSLRRRDQVGGKPSTSDVIDVARYPERRKRLSPFGRGLGKQTAGESQGQDQRADECLQ